MRTLNVFLASSEELDYYRMSFGNLVRRLDNVYEKRGVRIRLFEWEDYDAAYNDRRKQDEYNDFARRSDMFIAMFGEKANRFTLEEFDVALEEFCKRGGPKVYVYCEELEKVGKHATKELEEFQTRLSQELGYYWFRYDNRESMQFQFVMQLQHLENGMMEEVKVEGGNVVLDGLQVARMENLRFASANEDYQEMSRELAELPIKIDEARLRLDEHPEDEDLVEDLQRKLDKYNDLKGRFEEHQQLLFQAAIRVAKLQGEMITERMRDAMHALDDGRVRDAIDILDLAEEDAHRNLEGFKRSEEDMEQKRQMVFSSIDELLLKASSVMADASVSIEDRIKKADKIYIQADEMALECNYDKEKYADLLSDYANFLYEYAMYSKALAINLRLLSLRESLYGYDHPNIAASYNEIGLVYYSQGFYSKALECHFKALDIRDKYLGRIHSDTATSLNSIGLIYESQGDYDKALDYYSKALSIREKVLGYDHSDTATSYNNVGVVYYRQGSYAKALDFYLKDLNICEKKLGLLHPDTAISYNNIGVVHNIQGNYTKALEYHLKSLFIREKVLGSLHPSTAISYNNIGLVYNNNGNYPKALEFLKKALDIRLKVLPSGNPAFANSYNNIGLVYYNQHNYNMAIKYHSIALNKCILILGMKHPNTASSFNNIGMDYFELDNYPKALANFEEALDIRLNVLGLEHPDTAKTYFNIGNTYMNQEDYDMALDNHLKSLAIKEKIFGIKKSSLVASYNIISEIYLKLGDWTKAQEYSDKAK